MSSQQLLASFKIVIAGFHTANTNTGEYDVKLWDWTVSMARFLSLRSRGIKLCLKVDIYIQLLLTLVAFIKQPNFSAELGWEGESNSTQYSCWLRKLKRHFCARSLGFLGFCFCGICFYCSPPSLSWMQLSSDENPMQWAFRSWWIKNIFLFLFWLLLYFMMLLLLIVSPARAHRASMAMLGVGPVL